MASWAPVLAPEGTAADPLAPSSRSTSTSRVGLPRLSRISRAWMLAMMLMGNITRSKEDTDGGCSSDRVSVEQASRLFLLRQDQARRLLYGKRRRVPAGEQRGADCRPEPKETSGRLVSGVSRPDS